MSDLDAVIAAIAAGDYDGKLSEIADAIADRIRPGVVDVFWRIRLDGDEWTQETVTLGELAFAERVCKVNYIDEMGRTRIRPASMDEINPVVHAEHLAAVLTAHFHKADGLDLADAVKKAEGYPRSQLREAVDGYEVAAAPKDDPTSTPPTGS